MRNGDRACEGESGLKVAQASSPGGAGAAIVAHADSSPAFCVAGVLVHATAHCADDVAAQIARTPGATVHASAGGKLAITLESTEPARILDALITIQRLPAVMSAVLVSEHSEPLDTIDEELKDE
jgi:nitrate reductase NapAB chaperone NapD